MTASQIKTYRLGGTFLVWFDWGWDRACPVVGNTAIKVLPRFLYYRFIDRF